MQPQPTYPPLVAELESRIAVQDGYIWPIDRVQMVTPSAIRDRMVEDIEREVRERTEDAVVTCAQPAAAWAGISARSRRTPIMPSKSTRPRSAVRGARGAIVRRDSAVQIAASAVASLVFVVSLALWAGHATGAL